MCLRERPLCASRIGELRSQSCSICSVSPLHRWHRRGSQQIPAEMPQQPEEDLSRALSPMAGSVLTWPVSPRPQAVLPGLFDFLKTAGGVFLHNCHQWVPLRCTPTQGFNGKGGGSNPDRRVISRVHCLSWVGVLVADRGCRAPLVTLASEMRDKCESVTLESARGPVPWSVRGKRSRQCGTPITGALWLELRARCPRGLWKTGRRAVQVSKRAGIFQMEEDGAQRPGVPEEGSPGGLCVGGGPAEEASLVGA